jgi:hypothetical protein
LAYPATIAQVARPDHFRESPGQPGMYRVARGRDRHRSDWDVHGSKPEPFMADDGSEDGSEDTSRRGPLIAFAVVVVLLIISWLVFRELSASSRLEDCFLSGRTNCAPIEAPAR